MPTTRILPPSNAALIVRSLTSLHLDRTTRFAREFGEERIGQLGGLCLRVDLGQRFDRRDVARAAFPDRRLVHAALDLDRQLGADDLLRAALADREAQPSAQPDAATAIA